MKAEAIPTGWCSWYCFGPKVTAQNVEDNLGFIAQHLPQLRFVQIDDGYQPHMGDWLDAGMSFGGDVRALIANIRSRGFEPAIWVAPFIADQNSRLLREHPDWFIQNAQGKPLDSSHVSFGGWRIAPWFCLDGTHPSVQNHLENLFRVLRRDWGCTYFKLDANFWGALHGGVLHDPHATRIQAYRRGMEAILQGAGEAFILGCNAPMWPSMGLVHGQRTSGDIQRKWEVFEETGRENLLRGWQNGRLWWNDPDCLLLTGNLSDDEFQFHATLLFASGGMTLSGDDLTKMTPPRLAMLRKMLPPTGRAMGFDDTLSLGRLAQDGRELIAVFNWHNAPQARSVTLEQRCSIADFWSDADLGVHENRFELPILPPHSARLLIAQPVARSPR